MTPGRRHTPEERARALEVLKADGLAAAAHAADVSKSTILRWANAAGIDPASYSERSTEQNKRAAKAAVEARRAAILEKRGRLSDAILDKLTFSSVTLLADRLAEEEELKPLIAEAQERLAEAILSLELATAPDDPNDPSTKAEVEVKKEARRAARERVADARLVLAAYRSARIHVRDLVGILTRAVSDHLTLEGEAAEAAHTGEVTVILTAPRPARTPAPVVQLDPDPASR